jgi:hypothetical protein
MKEKSGQVAADWIDILELQAEPAPGGAIHHRFRGRIRSVTGSFGVVLFSSVRHGSLAGLPKPAIFFAGRKRLSRRVRERLPPAEQVERKCTKCSIA